MSAVTILSNIASTNRATSAAAYQTGQAGYAVTPAATAATYTQRPAAAAATGYETYQAAAAAAATGTTYAGEFCARIPHARLSRSAIDRFFAEGFDELRSIYTCIYRSWGCTLRDERVFRRA